MRERDFKGASYEDVARHVYKTWRWQQVRADMLERAGHRCAKCRKRAERLEVHHLVPIRAGGDPWSPRNLRVLCTPCHKAEHPELSFNRRTLAPHERERLRWRKFLAEERRKQA